MTVSILDRFMSDTSFEVSRSKFQLVGKNHSRIAISNTYFISGSTFAVYKCSYNLGSEKRFNHLMAVISTERYFASLGCTFLRVYNKMVNLLLREYNQHKIKTYVETRF